MNNIVSLHQLNQLISTTYVYAVVVFVAALALSFVVATLVPWQGGKDKSYVTRRVAFILIGIVSVLGFWLYNDLVVASDIRNAGFVNMFKSCNLKCLGITAGGYVVVGLIVMACFRNSKFGSILGGLKK
ncbi:MAG: hypothetical protein HUK09_02320 [Bacteroidaceae bacterium]|nr:hypothetical protein [Bacteroidaceae bacterium]